MKDMINFLVEHIVEVLIAIFGVSSLTMIAINKSYKKSNKNNINQSINGANGNIQAGGDIKISVSKGDERNA